ncbi:FIG042921: similarity to aminoacyl-tRNA editing enzymes YbaK, ProX [hydrothermal vent metagenome]|uniref:FIG042921: similarity to aminoacyl-tRNA editing enzymes YbaK, ProX n=1 Tax=hydrothermal vent metagenome TaxID=652676 RepID=A0A3B0RWP5_9ZZZZ
MDGDQKRLFDRFDELSIKTTTHNHAPAFTVEQARELRGTIAGGHCKNLFLKDKKGALWLIVCLEDARINLKTAPTKIGSARLSFGKPELLMETMGISPGSVTPFAVINDHDAVVNVILEQKMMQNGQLNYHPLKNDATTTIATDDLVAFIKSCGHRVQIVDLDET